MKEYYTYLLAVHDLYSSECILHKVLNIRICLKCATLGHPVPSSINHRQNLIADLNQGIPLELFEHKNWKNVSGAYFLRFAHSVWFVGKYSQNTTYLVALVKMQILLRSAEL